MATRIRFKIFAFLAAKVHSKVVPSGLSEVLVLGWSWEGKARRRGMTGPLHSAADGLYVATGSHFFP